MELSAEKRVGKDRSRIIKDHYEKFEKQSGKVSRIRKKSIESLQFDVDSILCSAFDDNYANTINYFIDNRNIQTIIRLNNGEYLVAYAVIYVEQDNEKNIYKISDIYIQNEDEIHDLANGEISMRKNIYAVVLNYIENYLNKINYDDYSIQFEMVDSIDLFDILMRKNYKFDDSIDLNDSLRRGTLQMSKNYELVKDEDELYLTRKQR